MQELIDYLMILKPVARLSKYCYGGNWERAIKIDLDKPSSLKPNEVVDDTVAVEVSYELDDSRMVFLGLRYSKDLESVKSPEVFLETVLQVIPKATHLSLMELMKLLGTVLSNDPEMYINKPVAYVELGVEGFWKTEGSLVIRKASEQKLDKKKVEKLLQQNSNLLENANGYTALEFAVNKPEAWIGVQVSKKVGNTFKTDIEELQMLANLI